MQQGRVTLPIDPPLDGFLRLTHRVPGHARHGVGIRISRYVEALRRLF